MPKKEEKDCRNFAVDVTDKKQIPNAIAKIEKDKCQKIKV